LASLKSLILEFQLPQYYRASASRPPPPSTRFAITVLTSFRFEGVSEYLEDLVACIDAPQLNTLRMTFCDYMLLSTPQMVRFISHTPMWNALKNAYLYFWQYTTILSFSSRGPLDWEFQVEIPCGGLGLQVSYLGQVCTSCLPPLSTLENLYFQEAPCSRRYRDVSVGNPPWRELFRPFMAVKNLYLSEKYASRIALALQELVEARTIDVLPALQNIFLEGGLELSGSVQKSIGQFVAARQVANHPPIGISPWTDWHEGEVEYDR